MTAMTFKSHASGINVAITIIIKVSHVNYQTIIVLKTITHRGVDILRIVRFLFICTPGRLICEVGGLNTSEKFNNHFKNNRTSKILFGRNYEIQKLAMREMNME